MTTLLIFDFNSNLEALNNCALSAPSLIISWFTAPSQPRSATTMIVAAEHQYLTDLFKRHRESYLRPPDASKVISVIASENCVQLFRCIVTYYCLHGPRFGFQPTVEREHRTVDHIYRSSPACPLDADSNDPYRIYISNTSSQLAILLADKVFCWSAASWAENYELSLMAWCPCTSHWNKSRGRTAWTE